MGRLICTNGTTKDLFNQTKMAGGFPTRYPGDVRARTHGQNVTLMKINVPRVMILSQKLGIFFFFLTRGHLLDSEGHLFEIKGHLFEIKGHSFVREGHFFDRKGHLI